MEIFERCTFWITKLTFTKSGMVTLSSVILFFSVHNCVTGQTPLLRLLGDTAELTCASSTPDDTYIWADLSTTPALNIYLVNDASDQEKSESAKNEPKYNNFGIANNYPGSVNLIIHSVEIEDEGQYQCTLFNVAADNVAYDVHVEALPISVSVSCTAQLPSECPEAAGVSSEFTCTCTALGAYPDDLHFEWTNAVGDPTPTNIEPSTNRSGAFDYTGIATFRPTETENTVTCSLGGYNGSWSVPDSKYTVDPPGKCDISISCNDKATVATLTCSCPRGVPEDAIYTYYDENGALVTSEVSVTPDMQFTVGCRGCNGVNYGEDTFIPKNHTCTVSTTAIPTTTLPTEIPSSTPDSNTTAASATTMTNDFTTVTAPTATTDENDTSKDSPGPSVALIASLSACGVILIVICVIGVIWFLKNRDGDSDKNKPDPPQNDDAVITMNASTTSSLAPLYGEVKKEKKKKSDDSVNDFGNKETPAVYAVPDKNKKSDKPDGNGAGPESDMPTYADVKKPPQPTAAPRTSQNVPDDQPMQELQYADLDHGKQPPTNEIRKPQDEPTEYATVQSVIV